MPDVENIVTMSKEEYDKEQEKAFDCGYESAMQALLNACTCNGANKTLSVDKIKKIVENIKEENGYEKDCELIDKNKIDFHCSYSGDCMASKDKCKSCPDYVCSYADI